jgi:muramoyltetrapeptide carboxypeptidase
MGKNALQIIEDVTKKYNIPVVYNFPAGHIRDNRAGYGEYSSS